MERLDQRREMPNTVQKLFKISLYCVLGFFTLLGLWFTVQYSVPGESPVDVKLERAQLVGEDGAAQPVEATLTGTYRRYRLGNENDEFFGTLNFDGRELEISVFFVPGAAYGLADTALGPVLLSRDGKCLLLEFTMQEQLCLLQAGDDLQSMVSAIADRDDWAGKFRWDLAAVKS